MASQIKPIGYTIGPMLSAVIKPIKLMIKQEGIPYSLEQLVLLKILKDNPESMVQQDIAEKLGKDKSLVLRFIDVLEKDGLVIRKVDPNDRRRNILEVTTLATKFIDQFHVIEIAISEKLFHNIPASDIETFFNVANTIKENAEQIS